MFFQTKTCNYHFSLGFFFFFNYNCLQVDKNQRNVCAVLSEMLQCCKIQLGYRELNKNYLE